MKRFDEIPTSLFGHPAAVDLKLAIRRARASDLKALHESCFGDRSLAQFGDSFRRSLEEQKQGQRLHLVAVMDGVPVASGQLARFSNLVEIADLAVAQEQRGKGIGSALIAVLEQVARFAGYEVLEIGVMQGNRQARALYERLGFVEDRRLTMGDGPTALILRKTLAGD